MIPWSNTPQRWGLVGILIHWLTAVAVVGLFALGLWMVDLTYYDSWYQTAPALHKSIGILLFIVTLLRLLWRQTGTTPRELDTHTDFEKKAARGAHIMMYLLLFATMIAGYLISTADGRAIAVFDLFEVPAILHGFDQQEEIAGDIHYVLAIILIAVAAVHAAAAFKHHFVDKDRTLLRMLGK